MAKTAPKTLTDIAVRACKPTLTVQDIAFAGSMYLRVMPSGLRSFWLRYKVPGTATRARYELGRYVEDDARGVTVKQANAAADQARAWIGQGLDPRAQRALQLAQLKQAEADALAALHAPPKYTVADLYTDWKRDELAGRRNAKSISDLDALFRLHIDPVLATLEAKAVRRPDVMRVLDALRTKGRKRTANVALQAIRQMFAFALLRDLTEVDPTAGLRQAHAGGGNKARERALSQDELRLLLAALPRANLAAHTVHAVWLLLATMCRVGEVSRARWSDLDLVAGTWTIPAEHAKNGRQHVVYLSPLALEHFAALHAMRKPEAVWVLPNRDDTRHIDTTALSKQLADRTRPNEGKRLQGRSKHASALVLPGGHWTTHDLRRSGASLMGDLDVPSDTIERCLNHTLPGVARVYQRSMRAEQARAAWLALGAKLVELAGPN